MKYLDIKDDGLHGANSDAILSNLGYCLASTNDEDFYNKFYRVGLDLSKIILSKYEADDFSKILTSSLNKINELGSGGCVKDDYNINGCYIDYISDMICLLRLYRKKGLIPRRLLGKNILIKFYTKYFFILNQSEHYKNIIINSSSIDLNLIFDETRI